MSTNGLPISVFMTGLAGGGAERAMLTLAEGFVERGLAVDLVVARAQGALKDDVPVHVRLVDLAAPRIIASLPALVRYFRRRRPAAMLAAMAPTNCLAVWGRALSRQRCRLVVSEQNVLSQSVEGSVHRRARLFPWLMRRTYPHSDVIAAVSRGVADDLAARLQLPRARIQVIPNPGMTKGMLARSYEPVDHPWFKPGAPPVVLGVGRLTRQKDFTTLVRAFASLRRVKNARLLILGEGEERERLGSLVRELGLGGDVMLPGFVGNPYAYMRGAALFVLSSVWEGFGNVLVEALACGTPVVSTDCPSGPAEILEDGRWGRLVPVGDFNCLAEAIQAVLDDSAVDRHALCSRAACFSSEKVVEEYTRLLLGTEHA